MKIRMIVISLRKIQKENSHDTNDGNKLLFRKRILVFHE